MATDATIDRRITVYAVWLSLGPLGFCLMLQGIAFDHLLTGASGALVLAGAFMGHLIVNTYFDQTFTPGEIAFGTAVLALWGVLILVSWVSFDLSTTDLLIAITFVLVTAGCVFGHIVTRHGGRGAFSRFHSRQPD